MTWKLAHLKRVKRTVWHLANFRRDQNDSYMSGCACVHVCLPKRARAYAWSIMSACTVCVCICVCARACKHNNQRKQSVLYDQPKESEWVSEWLRVWVWVIIENRQLSGLHTAEAASNYMGGRMMIVRLFIWICQMEFAAKSMNHDCAFIPLLCAYISHIAMDVLMDSHASWRDRLRPLIVWVANRHPLAYQFVWYTFPIQLEIDEYFSWIDLVTIELSILLSLTLPYSWFHP